VTLLTLAALLALGQFDLDNPIGGDTMVIDRVKLNYDAFGVREIYASAGRIWYVNMAAPGTLQDAGADPDWNYSTAAGNQPVYVDGGPANGAWRSSDLVAASFSGTRIQIGTTIPEANWHNVEITGYVYLESYQLDAGVDFALDFFARSGGQHTGSGSPPDCASGAYHQAITYDGGTEAQKEVYHTGGYTTTYRGVSADGTIPAISGRWVGLKTVIYDWNSGTNVKGEIWYDSGLLTNAWTQLATWTDSGGWGGGTPGCTYSGAVADLLLGSYPYAAFRADNAVWDWKYLSIREIAAPAQ
jgi:hypothetical protein